MRMKAMMQHQIQREVATEVPLLWHLNADSAVRG